MAYSSTLFMHILLNIFDCEPRESSNPNPNSNRKRLFTLSKLLRLSVIVILLRLYRYYINLTTQSPCVKYHMLTVSNITCLLCQMSHAYSVKYHMLTVSNIACLQCQISHAYCVKQATM